MSSEGTPERPSKKFRAASLSYVDKVQRYVRIFLDVAFYRTGRNDILQTTVYYANNSH